MNSECVMLGFQNIKEKCLLCRPIRINSKHYRTIMVVYTFLLVFMFTIVSFFHGLDDVQAIKETSLEFKDYQIIKEFCFIGHKHDNISGAANKMIHLMNTMIIAKISKMEVCYLNQAHSSDHNVTYDWLNNLFELPSCTGLFMPISVMEIPKCGTYFIWSHDSWGRDASWLDVPHTMMLFSFLNGDLLKNIKRKIRQITPTIHQKYCVHVRTGDNNLVPTLPKMHSALYLFGTKDKNIPLCQTNNCIIAGDRSNSKGLIDISLISKCHVLFSQGHSTFTAISSFFGVGLSVVENLNPISSFRHDRVISYNVFFQVFYK